MGTEDDAGNHRKSGELCGKRLPSAWISEKAGQNGYTADWAVCEKRYACDTLRTEEMLLRNWRTGEVREMYYWLMLLLSILAEVTGTVSIKYAGADAGFLAYLLLFSFVASSYYFLSKAVQGLSMGTAYAVWEGVGLIFMLVAGYYLFGEKIYKEKIVACISIFMGIFLLHHSKPDSARKDVER